MDKKLKKLVIASSVGLAFGVVTAAQALPLFRNNGTDAPVVVKAFNVDTGNFLFNNFNADDITTGGGSSFEFMGQAKVSNFVQNNGTSTQLNAALNFEYTVVLAAPMVAKVTTNGDNVKALSASLSAAIGGLTCTKGSACDPTQDATKANFFEIFYSAANSDISLGTGFTDGTLILQGHFVSNFPAPLNVNVTKSSLGPLTDASSGNGATNLQQLDSTGQGAPNFPTTQSIVITNGSSNFNIEIDYSNSSFFPTAPTFIDTNFLIKALQPQLTDPNTKTKPSLSYNEVLSVGTPNYGADTVGDAEAADAQLKIADDDARAAGASIPLTNTVNNWTCGATTTCDFTATGNDSGTFGSNNIPEPGSIAMMGLGLGLLGWSARRRKLAAV